MFTRRDFVAASLAAAAGAALPVGALAQATDPISRILALATDARGTSPGTRT